MPRRAPVWLDRGIGRGKAARLNGAPAVASAAPQGRLRDVLAAQAEAGEIGVAHGGQRVVAAGEFESLAHAVGEIIEEA